MDATTGLIVALALSALAIPVGIAFIRHAIKMVDHSTIGGKALSFLYGFLMMVLFVGSSLLAIKYLPWPPDTLRPLPLHPLNFARIYLAGWALVAIRWFRPDLPLTKKTGVVVATGLALIASADLTRWIVLALLLLGLHLSMIPNIAAATTLLNLVIWYFPVLRLFVPHEMERRESARQMRSALVRYTIGLAPVLALFTLAASLMKSSSFGLMLMELASMMTYCVIAGMVGWVTKHAPAFPREARQTVSPEIPEANASSTSASQPPRKTKTTELPEPLRITQR